MPGQQRSTDWIPLAVSRICLRYHVQVHSQAHTSTYEMCTWGRAPRASSRPLGWVHWNRCSLKIIFITEILLCGISQRILHVCQVTKSNNTAKPPSMTDTFCRFAWICLIVEKEVRLHERNLESILHMKDAFTILLHCCLKTALSRSKHQNHMWCITKEMCGIIYCNVYFHGTLKDNLQVYIIKRSTVVIHVLWAMSVKSSVEHQLLETCWSHWNWVFYHKVPVSKTFPRLTYNIHL